MSVPEETELADRISGEIAGIHRESYGEEILTIKTHVLDDLVVCVMDITLLTHERTLLGTGDKADTVRGTRQAFQEVIGATFIATVEHHTGRKVVGFLSDTHLDPNFSVEIFRLGPASAGEERLSES